MNSTNAHTKIAARLATAFAAALACAGAANATHAETTEPHVSQHNVMPIVLLRCAGCHGRRIREGGLDLRSRESMLAGGKSGPAIVPGRPEESRLLQRVLAEEMPPRRRLLEVSTKPMEPAEVEVLRRWIAAGAPEVGEAPRVGDADLRVTEEDRRFWSFRPPRAQPIPEVRHADRVENPIDAFVLERLEARGLALSPEADRRTLIRRAAFDLTGLPPEPEEVAAFLADPRADAVARMIDSLLGSPRYGERWGGYWLDRAGYADTEGKREQDIRRPFAYRYRDYVIGAFNDDKPYDRLLLEQLAGDELADYENAAEITPQIYDNLVATGFLRMVPDPTWANITGFVPDRLEVVDDAIAVLGSAVLGLTIQCARCHAHKFDPIPQRDYYGLVAILKGAYDEHDWLKPNAIMDLPALEANAEERGFRYLPHVPAAELRRWEARERDLKARIESLKKAENAKENDGRIRALERERRPRPQIRALWDRGEPSPTYLLRRGDYLDPGALVEPAVPAVLARDGPLKFERPWPGAKQTGRRLTLARWLTRADHPLTARVMVNAIWKHHFRHGLVKSLGNFGRTGLAPTHPELLDWLAREFVRRGWSIKSMHRLIMSSSTYRQASSVTPEHERLDIDNDLLSRFPMKRVEAEVLWDTLLLVAGRLDGRRFGSADAVNVRADGLVTAASTGGGWRRSIYVEHNRKQNMTLLECFDLPRQSPNCLERPISTVAPQALHLLNNEVVDELAGSFAERVLHEVGADPDQQIERAYRVALARPPTAPERRFGRMALERLAQEWGDAAGAPRKALASLCHVLINSAEFIYID